MRLISHGVDIVLCARIEHLWKTHAAHFLDRVYTPAEQRYCLDNKVTVARLSGRFAVKEAVMKCLGTGWRGGIEWTDIETLADPLGRPLCTLRGKTADLARTLGIAQVQVSISHAGEYAVATALGLGAV